MCSEQKKFTAKFTSKQDEPYEIVRKVSFTTYERQDRSGNLLGKYHQNDLWHFSSPEGAPSPWTDVVVTSHRLRVERGYLCRFY